MLIMKTVVCVVGGLGNQMFHAAYALALRTKGGNADLNDFLAAHGQSHYGSELMDVFHVKISKARYLVPFIWSSRRSIRRLCGLSLGCSGFYGLGSSPIT